ncbi:hypothetical protein DOM22_00385 [Bdellovibrio sp. ZAP7]|uniref:hypothetical protein n=1 Tax=Bdellovibrio sp. ZAP7 TaxID=2231053 RepID=UPI00116260A5|nr:hypothetical protein [Bdellovibrio sp. ZAP7]QDK43733.1 hypothetical protein DOM22_00385 [Bdellovibrio sp. ZAP7]
MRTTFLITILLFFSILARAGNDVGITYNPYGTSISQRILSFKSYEDIRVDSNLDGKIDEWYLKKGSFEIRISYKNGIKSSISFSKVENDIFSFKRFENVNGKFEITSNIQRQTITMFGQPSVCSPTELLISKASQLNEDISAIIGTQKSSCNIEQRPAFSKNLARVVQKLPSEGIKLAKCVQEAKNIKNVDVNLVSAKLLASYDKISLGQANSIFTCQAIEKGSFHGQTKEDGSVTLVVPTSSQDPIVNPNKLAPLLHHELLHAAGIKDESRVENMVSACLKSGTYSENISSEAPILTPENQAGVLSNLGSSTAVTKTADGKIVGESTTKKTPKKIERGVASAAAKTGGELDMKSEIANAEKVIPSAEKLSVAKVDKSPAGKEQALRDSVQESAPVFRMANQAMGISNTPALADLSSSSSWSSSPSYASGDSETGSSSRGSSSSSSGQRYQSRYGRYQSKSNGGVGADEYVAEEIDLTKNTESQAKKAANTTRTQVSRSGTYQPATLAPVEPGQTNSRGPASVDPEVTTGRKRTGSASNGDIGSGGGSIATGSAGGAADLNISSNSGGGGGTQSAQNRARSATSASRGPASTNQQGSPAQRQEIMTTLTNNDYVLTKRKLKDPSFLSELEANNVKVVDGNGSSWGAKSGTTIYYDDGNRFIRQR